MNPAEVDAAILRAAAERAEVGTRADDPGESKDPLLGLVVHAELQLSRPDVIAAVRRIHTGDPYQYIASVVSGRYRT